MARLSLLIIILTFFSFSAFAQLAKVLLIPLDDRPPCMQFTVRMGIIGNAVVVTPPRELLGKFTTAGEPDKIIDWIKNQDLSEFNAAIVSVDMLAYGGLVASRVNETSTERAVSRIQIIKEIRKRAPRLILYGQSVIMRLAPTGDGKNFPGTERLKQK